jgi:hypothetical protein
MEEGTTAAAVFLRAANRGLHIDFVGGDRAVGTDLPGCEADFRVAEYVALWVMLGEEWVAGCLGRLTVKRLTTPITMTMIPAPRTSRHAHKPMLWGLVAFLLRLAKSAFPTRTIEVPSMTKPDLGLKRGQLLVKYCLNRGSSVRTRKPVSRVSKASSMFPQAARLTTYNDGRDMLATVEEEEPADADNLDQHDRARSDDCQQTDYVEDADDVEHDVSSAGQGLSKAAHYDVKE